MIDPLKVDNPLALEVLMTPLNTPYLLDSFCKFYGNPSYFNGFTGINVHRPNYYLGLGLKMPFKTNNIRVTHCF